MKSVSHHVGVGHAIPTCDLGAEGCLHAGAFTVTLTIAGEGDGDVYNCGDDVRSAASPALRCTAHSGDQTSWDSNQDQCSFINC